MSPPSRNAKVPRGGEAARGERPLHHHLVHRDRGADDAGADVGQVGELEQALHRAVFAVGPVEEREHDVDVERAARRELRARRRGARERDQLPEPGRVRAVDQERVGQRAGAGVERGARTVGEQPLAVGGDGEGHDVVPRRDRARARPRPR